MDGIAIPARVLDGDFAGWLRDAMNERRVSSRTVAVRAGLHPRTVSQILYGGRQPTIETAAALLRYFGTNGSELDFGVPGHQGFLARVIQLARR